MIAVSIDTKRAEPLPSSMFAKRFAEHMVSDGAGPDLQVLKARYGPSLLEAVIASRSALATS